MRIRNDGTKGRKDDVFAPPLDLWRRDVDIFPPSSQERKKWCKNMWLTMMTQLPLNIQDFYNIEQTSLEQSQIRLA